MIVGKKAPRDGWGRTFEAAPAPLGRVAASVPSGCIERTPMAIACGTDCSEHGSVAVAAAAALARAAGYGFRRACRCRGRQSQCRRGPHSRSSAAEAPRLTALRPIRRVTSL